MRRWMTALAFAMACRGAAVDGKEDVGDPDDVPDEETDAPVGETDAPDRETDAPVGETDPPDGETDAPAGETDAPDTAPADPSDADGDGVIDAADVCPGLDDRVDLNGDGAPDCAQNLLTNGQMTSTVDPWWTYTQGTNTATAAWDARDASGWAGSGAAAVVNTSAMNAANAAGLISGCVTGVPGARYGLYFHYRLDSPVAQADTQIIPSFLTYSDDHCQVPAASSTPGPRATVRGGWQVYAVPGGLEMWPAWRSFQVDVTVFKPGVTAALPFALDDVLMLRE